MAPSALTFSSAPGSIGQPRNTAPVESVASSTAVRPVRSTDCSRYPPQRAAADPQVELLQRLDLPVMTARLELRLMRHQFPFEGTADLSRCGESNADSDRMAAAKRRSALVFSLGSGQGLSGHGRTAGVKPHGFSRWGEVTEETISPGRRVSGRAPKAGPAPTACPRRRAQRCRPRSWHRRSGRGHRHQFLEAQPAGRVERGRDTGANRGGELAAEHRPALLVVQLSACRKPVLRRGRRARSWFWPSAAVPRRTVRPG